MRKEEEFSGGSSDDGVVVREAETAMMTNMMKAMVTDMIMSKIVLEKAMVTDMIMTKIVLFS